MNIAKMNAILNILKIFCFVIFFAHAQFNENVNKTKDLEFEVKSEVLSRRKRFIVFPEGSSFQMVFCNTFPMIFEIGDIFLYGYTAALAWELPQDPYSPFDHHADPLHRRMDTKTVYYTNEEGRVLFKKPYKRKPIVNPAFAKRSVDSAHTEQIDEGIQEHKINRKQMHAANNDRKFLKSSDMEARSSKFHRSTRLSLYQKIETMLQGLGAHGKQCMLKTLCIVGKTNHHPQGEFLQEMLRSVFTLPEGSSKEEFHKDYDAAHSASESCDVLYPDCNETVLDPNSPVLSY